MVNGYNLTGAPVGFTVARALAPRLVERTAQPLLLVCSHVYGNLTLYNDFRATCTIFSPSMELKR